MKGTQKNKAFKADKQSPGCLGRMVNLFDLGAGVSANRLLTDKPHCDGSLSKRQSEVAGTLGTYAVNKPEDKMLYPDLRSVPNRNSHSTPMKMLIAQEMSKEIKSKHGPPNAVAKLMGLDALPGQQHNVVMQRAPSKDYSHRILSHSGQVTQNWAQEHDFLDKRMKWKAHDDEGHSNYRDVYEIQKEYQKMNSSREKSPQRGIYSEKEAKKKMELVRQKFMEAKRLATNEKLYQSEEFEDAVEVLSSNKEFFLKFLQEPNALISKHLYEFQSICAPPATNRITVLKPSKVCLEKFPTRGKKNEYPIKRPAQVVQETYVSYDVDEYANQPTRIVVLKPNAGKMCEIKSSVSVSFMSPRILHGEKTFEAEDSRTGESIQVAEENIFHMHGKFIGDWRDEALASSTLGDKSLFNKSENQYPLESFNDLEVMSPNSWHSWDRVNAFDSPFSSSSFSQRSHSPDTSVCREAKKRLSERWSMMASSGGSQEGRRVQRSSNTLAEMLALSDTKTSVINNEEGDGRDGVGTMSVLDKCDAIDMPVNLQRSKSLPASSTEYGNRIYCELSVQGALKTNSFKVSTKKSAASSFKGKFSNFFFGRNKRSSKDKCAPSRSTEESQSAASDTVESSSSAYPHNKVTYCVNQFAEDGQLEECSSPMLGFSDRSFPNLTEMEQKQGLVPLEGEISNLKYAMRRNSIDNPEQPSPISVLQLPYEEDNTVTPESSGKHLPVYPLMSNMISKSPPIESIARTLSWDDSCSGSTSPNPSEPASFETVEQDWLILVRKILSAAGLDEETQWDAFFFNWCSPENPLDALLLDRITSMEEEEPPHEAKRQQWRLNRKLVFDCVNEALVEIIGHGLNPTGPQRPVLSSGEPLLMVLDRVWALVREWLSYKAARDEWDGHSLAVEMAMREEVVVRRGQWTENFRLEISELGKEIERELLQELLDETLVDLL